MKIKESINYIFCNIKKLMFWFYAVIGVLFILFIILSLKYSGYENELSGIDTMSAFALLVFAIAGYFSARKMFIQNGISRKTHFISELIVMTLSAAVFSLIDNIIVFLISNLGPDNMTIASTYINLFQQDYNKMSISVFLASFVYNFAIYIIAVAFGSLIAKIAEKFGGYVVCIFFFVLFFCFTVVLPYIVSLGIIDIVFIENLFKVLNFILGITNNCPYIFLGFSVLIVTVLSVISFFVMRKSSLKIKNNL